MTSCRRLVVTTTVAALVVFASTSAAERVGASAARGSSAHGFVASDAPVVSSGPGTDLTRFTRVLGHGFAVALGALAVAGLVVGRAARRVAVPHRFTTAASPYSGRAPPRR
jgi:hypothetical protein